MVRARTLGGLIQVDPLPSDCDLYSEMPTSESGRTKKYVWPDFRAI